MLSSSLNLPHRVLCLFDFRLLFYNTLQIVRIGIGWLDNRHGPSPILRDTVYINQLFCYCIFIYFNFHWQLVSLLRDGSWHCFCLLAKSYETINQLIEPSTSAHLSWGGNYAFLLCTKLFHLHLVTQRRYLGTTFFIRTRDVFQQFINASGAQGRNEVRWRPGQEASLAPPCSSLRSFGSKCTLLKKVLVTCLRHYGALRSHFAARWIVPLRSLRPWRCIWRLTISHFLTVSSISVTKASESRIIFFRKDFISTTNSFNVTIPQIWNNLPISRPPMPSRPLHLQLRFHFADKTQLASSTKSKPCHFMAVTSQS